MYLNKLKITSTLTICKILILIGGMAWGMTIMFMIFAVMLAFKDPHNMAVYFVACAMALLMLGGISSGLTFPPLILMRRMYRAEKYNRIFEEDTDGMVSYEVFSRLTGFSGKRVRDDIRILTGKNFLRNVTYGWEGAMVIMRPETAGDFISVECPNCGAPVPMRTNGGARCQHCGTYMRSESAGA